MGGLKHQTRYLGLDRAGNWEPYEGSGQKEKSKFS